MVYINMEKFNSSLAINTKNIYYVRYCIYIFIVRNKTFIEILYPLYCGAKYFNSEIIISILLPALIYNARSNVKFAKMTEIHLRIVKSHFFFFYKYAISSLFI